MTSRPLQDSDSSHSQAIPATRPRRSVKPPQLKAAVITRRVQNQSKRKIAKDLGITRNTVATILEESHIEQHLQAFQVESVGLVPASLQVYRDRLAKGSEFVATKVLENTIWPLTSKAGKAGDPGLVLAIQNLMGNITVQSQANQQDKLAKPTLDLQPISTQSAQEPVTDSVSMHQNSAEKA